MGVWIETFDGTKVGFINDVTPFVGVWIETETKHIIMYDFRVTPFVGVWIETFTGNVRLEDLSSHPSWVCGLKHCRIIRQMY